MHKLFLFILIFSPFLLFAQSNNYWSRNFNEESSLLSGAVVGGGAGPSAIFYNPASISEIEESKLSINASLFSFEVIKAKNAWGEGIDFENTRTYAIPRFLSYMIKLKKHPKWSLEMAFLNNANYQVSNVNFVDENIDILKHTEGIERYTAFNNYENKHRDDWLGFGGSRMVGDNLSIGASMFVSANSLYYFYQLEIEAGPSIYDVDKEENPYFTAQYIEQELLKFNDYRLIWKIGSLYKTERFSIGLNITTPSLSGIYSDGKRILRKRSQSNITNEETGEPIPNYLITDYKEKKEVSVATKSPLSIAAGFTYYNTKKTKVLYTTVEYFGGKDPYRMIQANESNSVATGTIFEALSNKEWLTFVNGAKPLLNVAVGYRWIVKEDFMILAGFRTDFNHKKDFDFHPFTYSKTVKSFDLDKYHITGGTSLRIFGQDLITGVQYTIGTEKNQKQFVNLANPVEFNSEENKALQGTRNNTMNTILHSLSLYFGATINFGGEKKNNN